MGAHNAASQKCIECLLFIGNKVMAGLLCILTDVRFLIGSQRVCVADSKKREETKHSSAKV